MAGMLVKKNQLIVAGLVLALGGSLPTGTFGQKKTSETKAPGPDLKQSAEPDKLLYERAMLDLKRGHYTEGRLSLQTLINTYPDSEFLAKAKLATADSYYKEGGISNLTQAIDEYKNFIIFFPFLDEAAYAQMQVGMAHFKMMEKPDRDHAQAEQAEGEFQTFLLKYPQNPLVPQAEQKLRDIQEVLAGGDFSIARYYYVKQDYAASAARLIELTDRYPLYSGSDEALWMLAGIYSRAKQVSKNEDDKNHWADLAAKCYDRIVQQYPLSDLAANSKSRLKEMGMPVPDPDPAALAQMQKEQAYEKAHRTHAFMKMPLEMFRSAPNLAQAAHDGPPNLNPPNDVVSAREVLKQGAPGPSFTVIGGTAPAQEGGTSADDSNATVMEVTPTVTPAVPTGNVGVQIISAPNDPNAPPITPPGSGANATQPLADTPARSTAPPDTTTPAPTQNGTPDPGPAKASEGNKGQAGTPQKSDKNDPRTESTSKKKKGLKKIIPW
jgi:outer membrane protein assembly factor BamD